QRTVELLRALVAGPARIAHAVLVRDHRDPPPPGEPEECPEVSRKPGGAEIEEREVVRAVRKPRRQSLELRRASGNRLSRSGHAVVAVEDPKPRLRVPRGEEARPAGPGSTPACRPPGRPELH